MGTRLERFQETFGLDLRSLGVLRILIGCMLIVDYLVRAVDLRAHYTDAGVVPSAYQLARNVANHPGRFSFHLDGDLQTQVVLFGLSFLSAVTLLLGYRTKISLAASLALMISVQNRNMEIETGGDYLLRLVCLWCLFLPLGARFSLDARAGRSTPDPRSLNYKGNQYFSVATIGLIGQMAIVYFFSALHKNHAIWRVHDTAIHYALHIDAYDTSLGEFLRQFPAITGAMTRMTLGYETVAPWLIFSAGVLGLVPYIDRIAYPMQGSMRTLISTTFVFFHLGLAVTLSLGTFAWFAALIWLGLFPTWAWDRLDDFRRGVAPPDPYADDLPKEKDDDGKEKEPELPWFYRLRTPRVLRLLDRLEAFFVGFETPKKKKKKKKRKLPPRWIPSARSWVYDLGAGFVIIYTALWNLQTLDSKTFGPWIRGAGDSFLPDVRPVLNAIRLDQHWGLFAPYPRTSDGYYVVLLRKKSGEELDYLQDDHQVTWEKPDDVSGSYSTFRWRKYFRNIRRRSKRTHLSFYSNFLCREWKASHDGAEELQQVSIFFMRRRALAKGGYAPTKKERLWSQGCLHADRPYGQPVRAVHRLPPTVNLASPLKSPAR